MQLEPCHATWARGIMAGEIWIEVLLLTMAAEFYPAQHGTYGFGKAETGHVHR